MLETWVRSLGREDLLEKGVATYSGILAWRIPWTEEPGRLQSMELQRVRHNWATEHTSWRWKGPYRGPATHWARKATLPPWLPLNLPLCCLIISCGVLINIPLGLKLTNKLAAKVRKI